MMRIGKRLVFSLFCGSLSRQFCATRKGALHHPCLGCLDLSVGLLTVGGGIEAAGSNACFPEGSSRFNMESLLCAAMAPYLCVLSFVIITAIIATTAEFADWLKRVRNDCKLDEEFQNLRSVHYTYVCLASSDPGRDKAARERQLALGRFEQVLHDQMGRPPRCEGSFQRVQELEQQAVALQQQVEEAARTRANTSQRLRELEEELAASQREVEAARRDRAGADRTLWQQVEEAAQTRANISQRLRELEEELAASQREVEAERRDREGADRTLRQQVEEAAQTRANTSQRLRELEEELAALQREVEAERRDREGADRTLRQQVEEAAQTRANTSQRLRELEEELAASQWEVGAARRDHEGADRIPTPAQETELRPEQAQQNQVQACTECEEQRAEMMVCQERCKTVSAQLSGSDDQIRWLRKIVEKTLRGPRATACGETPGDVSSRTSSETLSQTSSESASALARALGFQMVYDEAAEGSLSSSTSSLSLKSYFSVRAPDPCCFMPDALFRMRSDSFVEGRSLVEGSQVVAWDGETVLKVVQRTVKQAGGNLVDLHAGPAHLRVTKDHLILVPGSNQGTSTYVPAGSLKEGDVVMLDSGEAAVLTHVGACKLPKRQEVLRLVFEPDLPVAVFSWPLSILSKGHCRQESRRGGMCERAKPSKPQATEGHPASAPTCPMEADGEGNSLPHLNLEEISGRIPDTASDFSD
ncbi:Hexb [Symbiodinium natans]|uniref:Hexb protein n=1 Tax=Symbiodinium natans TaxID=878477 RepID=A0A812QXT3_9DINO|nr:Hexb [Symbiodinium natans]